MKTCLVLGSEGFVGKAFCEWLQKTQNAAVRRIDLVLGPHRDLRTMNLGAELEDVDQVYFLAWKVGGAKYLYSADTQDEQMIWNLDLMRNVFPQLQSWGGPFLFVSSQLAGRPTVYGVQKHLGELWAGLCPRGKSVRLWNVYGAYEPLSARSHVVADFIHQALDTGVIKMQSCGHEERQFIYIDDVCQGFWDLLNVEDCGYSDLTSCRWHMVETVAGIIAELCGASIERAPCTGACVDLSTYPAQCCSSGHTSITEGLVRTVALFKERKSLA